VFAYHCTTRPICVLLLIIGKCIYIIRRQNGTPNNVPRVLLNYFIRLIDFSYARSRKLTKAISMFNSTMIIYTLNTVQSRPTRAHPAITNPRLRLGPHRSKKIRYSLVFIKYLSAGVNIITLNITYLLL